MSQQFFISVAYLNVDSYDIFTNLITNMMTRRELLFIALTDEPQAN